MNFLDILIIFFYKKSMGQDRRIRSLILGVKGLTFQQNTQKETRKDITYILMINKMVHCGEIVTELRLQNCLPQDHKSNAHILFSLLVYTHKQNRHTMAFTHPQQASKRHNRWPFTLKWYRIPSNRSRLQYHFVTCPLLNKIYLHPQTATFEIII